MIWPSHGIHCQMRKGVCGMQMYILSRKWGKGGLRAANDQACNHQDMHAPGPNQPCSMQREGVQHGRMGWVDAQLGHGRAWWTLVCLVLLTQCGWMLWVSAYSQCREEQSASFS